MQKSVSVESQTHGDTAIQPNVRDYQELSIRTGLLHAYCNTSFSFDTAMCCLLFYDWYVQKSRRTRRANNHGILSSNQ